MSSFSQLHRDTRADLSRAERRRPGRAEHVDPALLPLLRSGFDPAAVSGDLPLHDIEDNPDPLSPARGIAVALLLSGIFWAGIIVAIHFVIRHYGY